VLTPLTLLAMKLARYAVVALLLQPAIHLTPPFMPPGLSTLGVTLASRFQKPEWQAYRAALFVCLGLWGIVPMLHGWAANPGEGAVSQALGLDLLMGAIYIVSCAAVGCAASRGHGWLLWMC
jgi:predicted membrane channel-forming protein YqfA (hemolysin III family)